MIKLNNSSIWRPDFIATDIHDIDTNQLRLMGITHLVFDLDNTLLPHRTNTISEEYLERIGQMQQEGFTVMLGSNTRRDISSIIEMLHIQSVPSTWRSIKPFPSFYKRVIETGQTTPDHIAFIGDHMLNDVVGPNRTRMTSILVHSFDTRDHTLNAWYVRRLKKYE